MGVVVWLLLSVGANFPRVPYNLRPLTDLDSLKVKNQPAEFEGKTIRLQMQ
uniref:HDC08924 n=1 Tax=Drosophila melanogaster TaxID=7227 RepID=Q6ILM6_DROME|nr:TPA_inf: HDC08924 [Drosophila melanogaster]